ncbi:MAG: arsenate reductase ArsC [Thermoplasmataceae archaeon]
MKVLFVCIENAGRSKMAEAFGRSLGIDSMSAGTVPAAKVNPIVVEAMKEIGIELSESTPRNLDERMIEEADRIILMGCSIENVCPVVLLRKMKKKSEDWNLEDPKEKSIQKVREIRDEILRKVKILKKEID